MKTSTNFGFKWMIMVGMVLLLPLLGGCQDDELPDEVRTLNDAYKVIVGEWEWVKTTRVNRIDQTIHTITPITEGKTVIYSFMTDGKLLLTETGVPGKEYNFTLSPQDNRLIKENPYTKQFNLIKSNPDTGEMDVSFFIFSDNNTLVFYHGSLPGDSYYVRK